MTSALVHRGPDGEGYYVEGPVGLGHRRLSIIDLQSGVQPMFNEDRTLVVVYNGEIYNFQELRTALQKAGHEFRTNSDTEVLLHGYEQWGSDMLKHLRGMFAFAVWDGLQRKLFLARDRIGIKPLYYAWDGKTFWFGSELKAILQDPAVERLLDVQALDDYLTYMYIPAPKSIFRAIRKLRPGHYLVVDRAGAAERQYWDLDFGQRNGVLEKECCVELLEQLKEAVESHLVSDVPLGAFLSGGIDSSAVVAMMSACQTMPVRTASIGFCESGFDELPFARLVAERFHTDNYEKVVDPGAAHILEPLAWHFDEPFADSSMVPTYHVSGVAREQVKVCLSGDGGDENFAGYRRYRFDVLENRIRAWLPAFVRTPLFGALGAVYPKADRLPQVLRAKTMLTNLSLSPERGYFHTMSWFSPSLKRRLFRQAIVQELADYDPFSVMETYFARVPHLDPLSRIQYVDFKTYLCDDILTKVDRASMAHSLEVRVPLLDHRFVEFVARLPAVYKLRRGESKYIFKRALAAVLPNEILYRPKMGFSIPLSSWLRNELKAIFISKVLSTNAYVNSLFEPRAIHALWEKHLSGRRDFGFHLWALLMLEMWGNLFGK